MNKKLRFSWSHIIAFLALIFIAYVTFMGVTYYTQGNYLIAIIAAAVSVALLAGIMLGAQVLKGVDRKFHRSIVWERVLIFLSPLIILAALVPYSHFWTVLGRESEIVEKFSIAVKESQGVFTDYENYAKNRYAQLRDVLAKQNLTNQQRTNRLNELEMWLLSDNHKSFKQQVETWTSQVSKRPTVWNVFIFGNINKIEQAVTQWTKTLNKISMKHLSPESTNVQPFGNPNPHQQKAIADLKEMSGLYTDKSFPNVWAVVTILVCYAMLLFPYLIQERHSRNPYRFWDFLKKTPKDDFGDEGTSKNTRKNDSDIDERTAEF